MTDRPKVQQEPLLIHGVCPHCGLTLTDPEGFSRGVSGCPSCGHEVLVEAAPAADVTAGRVAS